MMTASVSKARKDIYSTYLRAELQLGPFPSCLVSKASHEGFDLSASIRDIIGPSAIVKTLVSESSSGQMMNV